MSISRTASAQLLRSSRDLTGVCLKHSLAPRRAFGASSIAAATTQPPKKQIILTSRDPGGKKWTELSTGQKVSRTASNSVSLLTIVAGILLTGGVFTVLYLEVFAPQSASNWFNTAHNRIKKDPECINLLGNKIKAYGEPSDSRWARNRRIASSTRKDRYGIEHLLIHFNVEGDIDRGVVRMHLTKKSGESEYKYKYFFLDVPGKPRIYLENADNESTNKEGSKKNFLGIKWGFDQEKAPPPIAPPTAVGEGTGKWRGERPGRGPV